MNKKLIIIPISALFLAACGSNGTYTPGGNTSSGQGEVSDPTDEDAIKSSLSSGIGFSELYSVIENSKSYDKNVMQVQYTYRKDKIEARAIGDSEDKTTVRVANIQVKRYDNDVIYREYSGDNDLRLEIDPDYTRGTLQVSYIWTDLSTINNTSQYLKDGVTSVYLNKIADYNVTTYEDSFYLGIASEVPSLVSASDYSLAGKFEDGTVYTRKQTVTHSNFTYNSITLPGEEIYSIEYFYKDDFLKTVRSSHKVHVDTNADSSYDLTTEFSIITNVYSTTSNGKFDKSTIPSKTAE